MRTLTLGDPALVGQGSAFDPTKLANLQALWWAEDLGLSDGDPIGSWVDTVSGITLTQTSTRRPTFKISGVGGKPVARLGGSQSMNVNTGTKPFTSLSGTVIGVMSFANTSAQHTPWIAGDSASNYFGGIHRATGKIAVEHVRSSANRAKIDGNSTLTNNTPTLVEWTSDGSAYGLQVNGVAQSLTVVGGANNGDWFGDCTYSIFSLGALIDTYSFHNGDIAFLAVLNQPISSGDRAALLAWAKDHYGIT